MVMSLSTLGLFAKQPKNDLTVEQIGAVCCVGGWVSSENSDKWFATGGIGVGACGLGAGGAAALGGTLLCIPVAGWVVGGIL